MLPGRVRLQYEASLLHPDSVSTYSQPFLAVAFTSLPFCLLFLKILIVYKLYLNRGTLCLLVKSNPTPIIKWTSRNQKESTGYLKCPSVVLFCY